MYLGLLKLSPPITFYQYDCFTPPNTRCFGFSVELKAGGLCLFVSMYLGLLKPLKHSDLYAEDQIGRFSLSAPHRLNIDHHNRA